jgi:hypothetical protein
MRAKTPREKPAIAPDGKGFEVLFELFDFEGVVGCPSFSFALAVFVEIEEEFDDGYEERTGGDADVSDVRDVNVGIKDGKLGIGIRFENDEEPKIRKGEVV